MRGRRLFASIVAAATATLVVTTSANATHGPSSPGPYDGYSTASVVHVDALTTEDLRVANVEVGVANAAVNSAGLRPVVSEHLRPIVPDASSVAHALATGSVVEAGLLLQPPSAANQLAPFRAESTAPGGQNVSESLLNQAISPIVFADLAHRGAATKWNDGSCVIGEPIAAGEQHLARVEVLETADDASTPASAGFDAPVAGLDANRAGPPRASSYVRAVEQLYQGAGPGLGLQSVVATTLAPVTLFQGTANELTIEVDGPAFLSSTADGTSGGAAIAFDVPLVTVIQDGVATEVLPGEPIEITVPGTGDVIAQVRAGVLDALSAPKGIGGNATTLANGTRAAAQAHVVEVKVLDLASSGLRGATIALGHMETAATVPAGGIRCPLPVTKTANPTTVRIGSNFATTITVRNPFACPLTGVTLTDVIGVERASRFTIAGAQPAAAASTGGSGLSAGNARWSLGAIPAGGSKSVVVTLRAEAGAGVIEDEATASGVLASCPAQPSRTAADVTGLARASVPASGISSLRVNTSATVVLSRELVPTGVEDVASVAAGLALMMLALVAAASLRRRA